MQGEETAEGGRRRALASRQVVARRDPAAVRIQRDEAAHGTRGDGGIVVPPYPDHGARSGDLLILQCLRLERRRQRLGLRDQDRGREHRGGIARRDRHGGAGTLAEGGGEPAAMKHLVLQGVDAIVKGEDGGRQRHDEMKRQADDPYHVMRVQPHALQIPAQAQRKEILDQRGQQDDNP